jgi:hypothetical protein
MTTTRNALTYDKQIADRLIPLLEVIVGELMDRTRAVRSLRRKLDQVLDLDGRLPESKPERHRAMELQARLATQIHECRLSNQELEKLSCVFDARRRVVRIPGLNGGLEGGFEWGLGTHSVNPAQAEDLAST